MLTVGVDTYVTLEEANQYISDHFASTDPLRIQWEAMSEGDREVYLRKAFVQINQLPYTGKPVKNTQTLPFPRYAQDGFTVVYNTDNLKKAQTEQAIGLTDTVAAQDVSDRLRLRRAGVRSYRIGDLSETFVNGTPSESASNFFGLVEAAYRYLSGWLRGGYKICTSIKEHFGLRWWEPLV